MIVARPLLPIAILLSTPVYAGQAPFAASAPDFAISGKDRVYAAEQFSNTVSVINPSTNENLGVIRLGDTQPMNLSPLYKGQVLVHGLGFSPGSTNARGCIDCLEFGDLHRHGYQPREAHNLRGAITARGVLHTGRSRSLGHRAR